MAEQYDTQFFSPGNNLWQKMPRLLMFSFERIFVLAADFGITYICLQTFFSYDWPWPKLVFLGVMVVLGIFLILPAPSNPLRLMWSEVLIRPLIGIRHKVINGSAVIEPLEAEEDI